MLVIKYNHGFKIKTKEDAKNFLNNCIKGNGSVTIPVNRHHCFFIRRNDSLNFTEIAEKVGDLENIFNPELVISDELMVDYIWKMRKYINKRWFNN